MVYFVLILVSLLWGLVPLAIKLALKDLPPFTLSFFRFLIAFITLFILNSFRSDQSKGRDLGAKIIVSILLAGNMIFYAYGIQFTSTISGVLLYTFGPAITAIGGYFLYKERISLWQILGIIIAFLGTAIIIFIPVLERGNSWEIGTFTGNILVTAAVISFSLYTVTSKPLLRNHSPVNLSTFTAGMAVLVFFFLSVIEFQKGLIVNAPSLVTVLAILYSGIGGTVSTLLLYQWLIKRTSSFIANLTAYIQVLTTGLAGYLFLEERITRLFVIGSILVLAGVFVVTNYGLLRRIRR